MHYNIIAALLHTRSSLMMKLQPSQLAKMVVFFLLLIIIPFVSTSMRTSYLYLLLNILIVVLGVEAGFLTAISPQVEARRAISTTTTPVKMEDVSRPNLEKDVYMQSVKLNTTPELAEVVEKKVVPAVKTEKKKKITRRPSLPSLFFIGSGEVEEEYEETVVEEEEEVVVGDAGSQELFTRAEMFIGNFYKQLKMQREDSWKEIHKMYDHRGLRVHPIYP